MSGEHDPAAAGGADGGAPAVPAPADATVTAAAGGRGHSAVPAPKDPTTVGSAGDPGATARAICLHLLAIAPRTKAQLAQAMRRRGVPPGAADEVLRRFTDAGLIDDAAFAAAWVESRHHSRGLSRQLLAAELRRRGVGEDDVHDAIDGLDPDQEAATARRLVQRKLAATQGQPAPARVRRAAGMLARKGYPAALVFRVVREALEQEGVDAAEAGLDDSAELWMHSSAEAEPG